MVGVPMDKPLRPSLPRLQHIYQSYLLEYLSVSTNLTFLYVIDESLQVRALACNIFTDVCLGALPVPIIWTLKMNLRVRIYVIGILNLAYL